MYIYIYKGQIQLHNLKMQLGNLGRKWREVNIPKGACAWVKGLDIAKKNILLKKPYFSSLHFPQDLLCVFLATANNTIRKIGTPQNNFIKLLLWLFPSKLAQKNNKYCGEKPLKPQHINLVSKDWNNKDLPTLNALYYKSNIVYYGKFGKREKLYKSRF